MNIKDIYWVAGLLEGEGNFNYYNAPRIFLKMTDFDTVSKARDIMGVNIGIGERDRNGWKTAYILAVNSHYAIGWMMTIYPLMSARRKEQIRNVLSKWRNAKSHNGFTVTTGDKLISMIARKHMISHYEARKRLYNGEFITDSDGRTFIGNPLKQNITPKIIGELKQLFNPFAKNTLVNDKKEVSPCQEL